MVKNLKYEDARRVEEKYDVDPDEIMMLTDEEWAESQGIKGDINVYDDYDLNKDLYDKYYGLIAEYNEVTAILESEETVNFENNLHRIRESRTGEITPEMLQKYVGIIEMRFKQSKLAKEIQKFPYRYRKRKSGRPR